MSQVVRMLILGESALLEGVAVGLEHDPQLALQKVQAGASDTLQLIAQFNPDAILYQLNCPDSAHVLAQLPPLSGVRLLGLDAASDQVLVVDRQMVATRSIREIRRLILAPGTLDLGTGALDQQAAGERSLEPGEVTL